MEHAYQYSWIIPFVTLPIPILIGMGLLLFPTATKNLRRMWAFPNILLLSIVMIFSLDLSIQQINGSSIYQYVWSWTINNDFSFEFGYFIDSLTSIMSILITTVGIFVLIYSDNYMSHDEGYLRFFAYMSLFNTSMLGLVTSSNLIQIYIFWELVGMCSYLLIGFWFTRPAAANACQKAFVTNRIGDFASGSIIHSMEAIVGYSPEKSQNMVFMGGLRKHVPITQIAFLVGTLSLCGIPPLACFWSKDEILSDSWLYSPIFAIIAWSTAGLTAFYMFRIYLLTFEGHLNVHFQKYSVKKSSSFIP
ncbi:NADH dehydrogenase [Gossypium australe]|uniref:NAD(P)H-quinone oxidoreductase subunit 5, chloroplastic n=1 Tax=Gossypium australe TaxID=47621 RepID=A0A5B6X7T1_9ROSI|nr:NADH dehydrogenase [Gossypium australe]